MVAQFDGGPLHRTECDVDTLPGWLWYAHDPDPGYDVWSPAHGLMRDSTVRYHRYQMVSGVYHHTGEHRQVTTVSGDAWLHLYKPPHPARIVYIPHP